MSIMTKRNAVLGWAVWKVGKRVGKKKARSVLPGAAGESSRAKKPAIVAALAALGGALFFWRKKRSGGESGE